MNWGTKIILAYLAFILILTSMVVVCINQDVHLVATDYYKQEITYQDQIDRMNNYNTLTEKPTLQLDRNASTIIVTFTREIPRNLASGKVWLFRPSDRNMDQLFKLVLDTNGQMILPTANLSSGLWKLKLNWSGDNKEYYHEKTIIL